MAPTKRGTLNTIAVLVIVLLSIGGGFAVQRIMRSYRLKEYPKNYEEAVSAYSAENRIPDYVVYASIKVRSDFDASLRSDDGRTGLFQLTDRQFYDLSNTEEESDPRLLYDKTRMQMDLLALREIRRLDRGMGGDVRRRGKGRRLDDYRQRRSEDSRFDTRQGNRGIRREDKRRGKDLQIALFRRIFRMSRPEE